MSDNAATFTALEDIAKEANKDRAPGQEKKTVQRPSSPAPRRASLEKRLTEFFTGIALVVTPFDQHCAGVVATNAPALGAAWSDAADNNPRLKKAIEGLLSGGSFGQAAFVTAQTIIPILMHHGIISFRLGVIEGEGIPEEDETSKPVS